MQIALQIFVQNTLKIVLQNNLTLDRGKRGILLLYVSIGQKKVAGLWNFLARQTEYILTAESWTLVGTNGFTRQD